MALISYINSPGADSIIGPGCPVCAAPIVWAESNNLTSAFTPPVGHRLRIEGQVVYWLQCPARSGEWEEKDG